MRHGPKNVRPSTPKIPNPPIRSPKDHQKVTKRFKDVRRGVKNVQHGAENVGHNAEYVWHGAKNMRPGAKKYVAWCQKYAAWCQKCAEWCQKCVVWCQKCAIQYPHDPLRSLILQSSNPRPTTDDGVQTTKQHPKYRATADFQSRGELEVWILAIMTKSLKKHSEQ